MTKTMWGDIKSPLTATVPKDQPSVEAAGLSGNLVESAGLEQVVIVTDAGLKIPALVDQSSRTVYPKRND